MKLQRHLQPSHNYHIFLLVIFWLNQPWTVDSNLAAKSTAIELKHAQQAINNETAPFCFGTGHSQTKNSFLRKSYQKHLNSNLALVYPFCLTTNELGNRLGNYLNELACADVVGVNFIAVHKEWDLTNANQSIEAGRATTMQRLAFLNSLPDVVVHMHQLDEATAFKKINEECKCTRYCWQDRNAPWVKSIPMIRKVLRKAIAAYLAKLDPAIGTTISPDTDTTNAPAGQFLPVIPDVSIQYRCGDNIGFSYMYGILPFTAFPSRIPANSKFIYVLSDHPSRAPHSPYSSRCQIILQSLFEYLKEHFPSATVVVKRGGDVFLDYARLAFSNTTICSASSYCMWPALANNGTAHFPLTVIAAGADTIKLAPNLISNFHWIESPEIISDLRKVRPWTAIVDILKGTAQMPA